tara:strand:- start:3541 stop:3705 length:165 start_codon:yes stop_codon:yes gene_type:complete
MRYIFHKNPAFNQEIRNWDVSNVSTFMAMFSQATRMNAAPWNAPESPDASWFNQ